jgi:hypothetical protein
MPNHNAAALLCNNRFLHHQGSKVLHHNSWCPELQHRIPKYNSACRWLRCESLRPEVLLCPELLHHQGDGDTWLRMLPHLTTSEASKYYSVLIYLLNLFSSTTLFPAATPRLPLITPPKRLNTTRYLAATTPKRLSITLPRSTQPQLRRPIITQSRLATQKLLFRATLNTTLVLQSTTPRSTLDLATTPQPPSTTPKKPPFTQPRTLTGILHRGF